MSTTHALYRFFDETGQLLYVGISVDPGRRFAQHRSDKTWWEQIASITVQKVADRRAALDAEEAAIKHERPKYNVVHNQAVTNAPVNNPEELFRLVRRANLFAREQGGEHVEILAGEAKRHGLNEAESLMVAWAEWSDFKITELRFAIEKLLSQFPFEQTNPLRKAAEAELIANGRALTELDLAHLTASALADERARAYLGNVRESLVDGFIRGYTHDGVTQWAEAASDARGWVSFDEQSEGVPL